jgi:hypothetical protein
MTDSETIAPHHNLTDDPKTQHWKRISLVASVVLFLIFAQQIFVYTPDDAFITYRYSQNVAEGYGPVFNRNAPVSDRAEGYSCPLFMFACALLIKLPLGMDLMVKTKLLGLACGIALLFLAPKLAARMGLPPWAQCVLPLVLSVHSAFTVSSIDGMETMLAMLLSTLAVYRFLIEWSEPPKAIPLSAVLFALCALNRPEALLFGCCAFAVLVLGVRRGISTRHLLLWTLTFAVPVAAWFLFRKAYYGVWMPNTFYAKHIELQNALVKGVGYLMRTFFRQVEEKIVYGTIGAAWWLLVIVGSVGDRGRRSPNVLVPMMVAMQIVFTLRSGGDWMSSWRYMAAALVLGMILCLAGIADIVDALAAKPKLATTTAAAFTVFLFAAGVWGQSDFWGKWYPGYHSWASKRFSSDTRTLLNGWMLEKVVRLSDELNKNVPAGSVVAYSEMGVCPYLSPNIRFLDVRGLTDSGIAHLPGTQHEQTGVMDRYEQVNNPVGRYLLEERKPDYVLFGARLDPAQALTNGAVSTSYVENLPILDGAYIADVVFHNPPDPPGYVDVMGIFKRRE